MIKNLQRRVFTSTAIALACGHLLFVILTNPAHKPDFNNTASGGLNLGGWVHVAYCGICWAMAMISLAHIIEGGLRGPVMWYGLIGGVTYLVTQVMDHALGNFQPLTKV